MEKKENNCSRVDCEKVIVKYYNASKLPEVKMKNQYEPYLVMSVIGVGLSFGFYIISFLNGMFQ